MRVLIIKTSSLGDVIHALPVLDYIHQAAPGATIDWVVDEAFADLLSGNPLIGRLIQVAFRRWKKNPFSIPVLKEILVLRRKLREQPYDMVFDLQGNIKSGLVCAFSIAPLKVGFCRENQQERLNSLFTNRKVAFLPMDKNAAPRYLRVVSAPFSLPPESVVPHADIHTSREDDCYAGQVIEEASGRPAILFHNGTTWETKLWHADGWKRLADEILLRYPQATILLSWGSQKEYALAQEIARHTGNRAIVLEKMPLKRFVAVLKRVDLVVGGDTGPIHLAAAVGTPTVSFYRCTDGSLNGPWGQGHRIVQSPLACTKCLKKSCERDDECRRSIAVDAMLAAIDACLAGGTGDRG
jgi:heptosyltransferase-1